MGSQRITSKVSNSGIFGTSPLNDTLQAKYTQQTTKIKERFDSLGVAYSGLEQSGGLVSTPPSGGWGANPSGGWGAFFYHPNHLGSSSLITDGNGHLVQHIQYVPFGEVFIEQRNASWSTPYKFNGKELDEETGLAYYHARYYDPRTSVWLSVDPLAEKFAGWSSYVYAFNSPVKYVDLDGLKPTKSQAAAMAWHIYDGKKGDYIEGWNLTDVYISKENPGFKAGLYTREVDGKNEYHLVNMGTIPGKGKKNLDSMIENIEQVFGGSEHMKLSIEIAKRLNLELGNDADLTFGGHSKGGGEAAANAIATNRDAYVFNPAAVNLNAYELDYENYTAVMNAFVVIGDPVSWTFTLLKAKPIGQLIMLPRQSWLNPVTNHNNFVEALKQYLDINKTQD